MTTPSALIDEWLAPYLDEAQRAWLDDAIAAATTNQRAWNIAFATAPRRVGHAVWQLEPSAQAQAQAQSVRCGWQPQYETLSQAVRIRLLLAVPDDDLPQRLADIFATADLGESVACYRGLPIFAHPEAYRTRAAEGVRSNVQDIFCAVAHHNPYPSEQLDDGAWNQMVLKALFVGVPLHPIIGLDQRANPDLARMLSDYARERRAASRTISPELWRCVGPHADAAGIELLAAVLGENDALSADAAALALASNGSEAAQTALTNDSARRNAIANGTLDWTTVVKRIPAP